MWCITRPSRRHSSSRCGELTKKLKEEEIVNKVGGRFKLSTLIQKRLVQLNQGSRALVNVDTHDRMQIVLQEIVQDKIYLSTDNEVKTVEDLQIVPEGPPLKRWPSGAQVMLC